MVDIRSISSDMSVHYAMRCRTKAWIIVPCCTFKLSLTTRWRHQMETFSALPAICAGNLPVSGEFPAQRPVTRSFDIFFDLHLDGRLGKQSWGLWLETPSCPLWRQTNEWKIYYWIIFKKKHRMIWGGHDNAINTFDESSQYFKVNSVHFH